MDYRALETKFPESRQEQMGSFNRKFAETDRKASQVVFNTAVEAIQDVKTGNLTTFMQAASLTTGLGKSTSAYAFIATFPQHDPEVSAAYVVPTIIMAEEAQLIKPRQSAAFSPCL